MLSRHSARYFCTLQMGTMTDTRVVGSLDMYKYLRIHSMAPGKLEKRKRIYSSGSVGGGNYRKNQPC